MIPSSGDLSRLYEMARPYLLEGRSGYHFWFGSSTFMVVLGVAMEGWEVAKDVLKEFEKYPFAPSKDWPKLVGSVGWILIVLGVAGEMWFDSKISDFDNGIRMVDEELLKQSRVEASNANLRAALANQEAAAAVTQAGDVAEKAKALGDLLDDERKRSMKAEDTIRDATGQSRTAQIQLAESQAREELLSQRRRPRGDLLRDRLKPTDLRLLWFGGQSVTVVNCDALLMQLFGVIRPEAIALRQYSDEPAVIERRDLFREVRISLRGALWAEHGIGVHPCTTNSAGILIMVEPEANERAYSAANTLQALLHESLLLEGANTPPISVFRVDQAMHDMARNVGADSSDNVWVFIGEKPPL